jgi:glycosyltransferase involved in cell wall biosynthesis
MSTTLVVPCFNEATRLPVDRFVGFIGAQPSVRLLFVNDGSSDSTLERLLEVRRASPERVEIRDLPHNVGKAEAVRQGMITAFDGASFAGYWDADLSTPLEELQHFTELMHRRPEIEMVFGARVKLLGRTIERHPWRHYPGRVFATLASEMLGLPIYDTQCGAKLFRSSPEIAALFARPFLSNWTFDVEILARLVAARRDTAAPPPESIIYEHPLHEWRDVGESKVRGVDFLRALLELVRIRRRYL